MEATEPANPALQRILHMLPSHIGFYLAIIFTIFIGVFLFLMSTVGDYMRTFAILLVLAMVSAFFKKMDKYSRFGGLSAMRPMCLIVTVTQGPFVGLLFATVTAVTGAIAAYQAPQYAMVHLFGNLMCVLVGTMISLTPENIIFYSMIVIIVTNIITSVLNVILGTPLHPEVMYLFVNPLWNFVLLRGAGVYVLQLLTVAT